MDTNNQSQKSIKEAVLEKIKSGQVKMQPKTLFVLKTILIVAGAIIIGCLVIFLISFITFQLRVSGILYLPDFGFRGLGTYLRLLPWFLILIILISILVLEKLTKRFSFVWHRPLFYSLLAIILIVLIGSLIVDKTSVHPGLFLQVRQGKMNFMAPVYSGFGMPRFKDVHRGVVEELAEESFSLRNADNELLTVILSSDTRFPIKEQIKAGDTVVIMGPRDDGTVRAFGILKINDRFNKFERPVPRLPR